MKLKKILAAVAAAVVAVSTMAVNAFAIKDYPDGYVLDLIAEGYDVTAVAGFTFKISGDIDSGTGGGVGFNSATTGWDSTEWGNADAGKTINASGGEVTIKRDAPVFKESDVTDPKNPYAQIWMQQWWGTDVTIDSVTVLDVDGNALAAGAVAPADDAAPADDTAADEATDDKAAAEADSADLADDDDADADIVDVDTDDDADDDNAADTADTTADTAAPATTEAVAPAADTTTAAAATGNVAVASIVAVMAVAGAAAIVSKKRK